MHSTGEIILGTLSLMFLVVLILTVLFYIMEEAIYGVKRKNRRESNGQSRKKIGREKEGTEDFY